MKNIRRIVTGHDGDARARIVRDGEVAFRDAVGGDARFSVVWTTKTSPADNADEQDGGDPSVALAVKGGTVLRVVDMKPGARSPFHRTVSLDYGIVLEGEVVLELDDGVETTITQGDIVVQRGTIHAWTNRTDRWARMAFVLIDAEPLIVNGSPIDEHDANH